MALVEEACRTALADIPDGWPSKIGVAAGRAAGEATLTLRKDDGATRSAPYTPASGPGRWRSHPNPEPANPPIRDPKLAPGFAASMLPWLGQCHAIHYCCRPRNIGRLAHQHCRVRSTHDFNEVKIRRRQVSTVRTPEQTEVARFRFEGPLAWYRVARAASEAKGLDLGDSARALAAAVAGDGRQLHRRLQDPLRLRLLAAGYGDQVDSRRRQRGNWRRSDVEKPSEHTLGFGLCLDLKPVQWRGGDRTSWGFRYRPGRIHHHERSAILKHPAVVLQLLGGRQGERRLPDLRRYPLLLSL